MEEEQKICDSRFPLSFYFRIANQIIKQARVYRDEQSIKDLYSTLNRYSSLVSKIIPQHPCYLTYSSKEKLRHRKILKEFNKEMETLKPRLGRNVQQVERPKSNRSGSNHAVNESKVKYCGIVGNNIQRNPTVLRLKCCSLAHDRLSVGDIDHDPRPDISANCVTVVRSGSIQHYFVPAEDVELSSVVMVDPSTCCAPCEPPCMSSTMAKDGNINVHIVTQSSPSPVLSFIEDAPHAAHIAHVNSNSRNGNSSSSFNESSTSEIIHDVHISVRLMEDFLELAKDNTEKDLETCGVLGAFLKNQIFYVTTLIIPKQESTCSSCQALNEEEIHSIQEKQSLFPVGWIHTHPSQSCFMSSIDLHTHYPYQLMLPEAFAIVMAPTDATKNYGIFRLTDPGGTTVLKECPERGFHPHKEPPDGGPLYEECSNVYVNSNLRFEIIDLR